VRHLIKQHGQVSAGKHITNIPASPSPRVHDIC
jgi:hypothetical protein